MCGIIGAIAKNDVTALLLEGLKRLEYRGYDSAGIAIKSAQHPSIQRERSEGKVNRLINICNSAQLTGELGIAHTRWATHGKPSENNAHPHISGKTAIVHNGIIENHDLLRQQLHQQGYQFCSETDSEVVAHLISAAYEQCHDLLQAVQTAVAELHGAFALGIIHQDEPNKLIAVRHGSPLIVGSLGNGYCISSDPMALIGHAEHYTSLEDGDIALISCDNMVLNNQGKAVVRATLPMTTMTYSADRLGYRHFMLKEINEQPSVLSDALDGRLSQTKIRLNDIDQSKHSWLHDIEHIQISACGTSFHAGLVAKHWLEDIAKLPCQVEVASELRHRSHIVHPKTLFIAISQSGETADTLAALHANKHLYHHTLAICNVADSALIRACDDHLLTRAGIEVSVASTKAFTTQLTVLLLLTLCFAQIKQRADNKQMQSWIKSLRHLPLAAEQMLQLNDAIYQLAPRFNNKHHTLFLGRGVHYPIALEGALKLKEISYIHAEAYPAGELKHGPLALVDKDMPIIVVAPNNHLLTKLKGNLQEVKARGGALMVFADAAVELAHPDITMITLPVVDELIAPIVHTIPLQLLAYHVAVLKGTDVDQPRNLAKSVTVE